MEKVFHAGEKIFFTTLITCIMSYLYFTILPLNEITISIGCIFLIIYFGINYYIGSTSDLKTLDCIIVGIIGASMGIILLLFALYSDLIIRNHEFAMWIIKPYYIATMSLISVYFSHITIFYPIVLIGINISLVVMGNINKRIMNKFRIKI